MQLSAMAAVMLAAAVFTGLIDDTLISAFGEERRSGFLLFSFVTLAALLRQADVRLSPECEVNVGCVFASALLVSVATFKRGRVLLESVPGVLTLSFAAAVLIRELDADAAVLASSLLPLAAWLFTRSFWTAVFACGAIPLFAGAAGLIVDLAAEGYGVFALGGLHLDLCLVSLAAAVFARELAVFSGRLKRAERLRHTKPARSVITR